MKTNRPREQVWARRPGVASCGSPAAGWRALVPGYAQWSCGQRDRGVVRFGSFASALVASVFAWGTPLGLGLLAFAFGAHVASVVDALRQAAFPPMGRWAPWLATGGWLGVLIYGPLLASLSLLAWPG